MRYIFLILSVLSLLYSCSLLDKGIIRYEKQLHRKGIFPIDFKSNSETIHYWKGGKGPVILFLHGFGLDALLTWRNELITLSRTHTVIAPDLLWFGKSYSKAIPNLASQRKAIEEVLSHLCIDSLSIVGQSYGGFIALDLAATSSLKIEKLVIANCPGTTFHLSDLGSVCAAYGVREIDELFVFDDPKQLQRLINLSTFSNPTIKTKLSVELYKHYFAANHDERRTLMRSLPLEQQRFEDPSIFRNYHMMVLWGEKDELFALSEGERFAESTSAKLEVIPKCGHAPQVDDHHSFLKLIRQFFQ
jgi:pimeloyl-ACP methyl ester carboxylesterase